ncbi:MAG: family 43 glycosylhydrolase [Eubacterium sp.]|nr:family 43 glycosylhydrolase [Eubacterium sp.]
MFGTGLTVYHSDDAYIWKAVGDDKGRCGYQNQQLFGSDYVTALAGPLGWTKSSPENKPGAGYLVWAPHVMYNTTINKWCFYGSTSAWGALQSEIFMGTSDNITGPYTNITTIARSVSTENKVNAIDPATFYAPDGTLYMVYGSYQTGIAIKKLNADGTCIGGESKYIADLNVSLDDGGAKLITTVEGIGSGEGPFVKYQNGWYYLYVAYGGNGWNYTTRVFRSKNPEGPYAGINGVEANSTLSNDERMRGNQFMSSYLIQGNEWINSGTAHNSIFNAENDKGEIVTLNAVHSRPLATSQTDKMNAVEDGAMATRQSDLSGNNTVINMVGYTESGWPVTFPLKYNGTDSLKLGNVTARDLAGIYAGNKFDMGLAWNQYNGLYTFRMVATDDYNGVLYGTEYNGTLFTFDFEIINYDTNTWVRFKNSEGIVVREATVATQVKDGKTVYELGFINCDATSESYGKQVWCYKGQDLPNPDDVESNAVAVDMDQIIYTHKANEEYYLYGQEISDNLDYDPITHNFGERATKIRVKYPYRIDTSDPGAVYCYSDEQICADYGCSGSGLYAELVKEAKAEGEYSEYILRGYVSDYFKYNTDTDSYTEDGVILIISYKDENGKEYSEFAFSYVMPNPAMAHTLQFMRNQNVRTGNDKRISTGLYTRFIGSEGAATEIVSTLTNSPHATFTTEPIRDTGTYKYLATFGDAESINDANYDTPALIESQFNKFDKTVGVNAGSFGAAEHNDNQDGWYTNTSAVVQADYYLDYSNPDNPIINRDANGTPTGYSITYLASNLLWNPKTDSQFGTSYMNNRTGLSADLTYTANTDILVDTSLQQLDKYLIGENGRKVMSGSVTNSTYSDPNFESGLVPAFTKISGTQATSNTWTGQIVLTGKDSIDKLPLVDSSDPNAAEKSSNFIMEQGTNNWWKNLVSSNYTSEEIYSYYNIGVSTCDKGAVREFVETFANKKLNIVRNKATGKIQTIEAVGDLVGSDYSAASYREYMRALSEGFFFVENTKNTRYEENGVEKAYTTAYGTTPDGGTHSYIYTDEIGNNIFGDDTTNTDPVQAQIIENIISKYEALFTIEKFNSCQETINENKEFAELQKESGNYTDETVNNFNEFLTEASKYFEYYLDKENPVENQDYWRYTKLTGSEYDELLELVNSYKRSLMPVVDSTELQTQIDVKTPLLNDGIFAETESGEKVQVKTMSSWIAMDNAVNKAKQDKIDTAGNAKYETLEPETIILDNKEYTFAEPDINTLSADQILVNDDTDVVKAAELKDCDASDRYVSYDAVVDVVSAMERDRYTPEALAKFDEFVDQLSNGTDLTKPSVYVLATDEIASNYNKATGDNVAAGTKLCATAQDETDPLTTQLLEMLNGLEVNLYTSYLTVQTLDENGDATATITNAKDQKYYGEMFTFDTGADDNAVVTWLVQTFRKGDLDKYMNAVDDEDGNKVYNGEIIKPLAVSRLSSYTGSDMLRKADCDMKVTAQINASETAATGVVLKVYNGYNNITDVIYAADIETAKSKLVDPVMPFYNFKEWNIIDQGDNKFVAKPVFDSIPTVTVTVSEGNSLAGKKLSGNIAESGTEVTVSTSNAEFYAWAVKTADNKYQIVSYSKSYTFVAIVDEAYTLITTDGDKYYADGTELTADMVDQFVNTTDNGMTADEYFKLKLDNKAPFIYKQGADLGGRKIFIRVTSGADENDIRAYGLNILNNDDNTAKKYPASKKAVSGQFYMSLSEAAYAKYSADPYQIQCFVTYSFSYEFNGKVYQINTTDYFNV